jgi:hypothetical protein
MSIDIRFPIPTSFETDGRKEWAMLVSDEEAYMFAERYAHFSNVHTIYRDLISGHYKPSVEMPKEKEGDWDITDMSTTAQLTRQDATASPASACRSSASWTKPSTPQFFRRKKRD